MLNDELIKEIAYVEHGRELMHIWAWAYDEGDDFASRRDAFFWILDYLLRAGYVKLRKMNGGPSLEGTPEELVNLFRKAWPESIEASGYEDFNWWFFDDDCPAGVAWRLEDGSYR